MTELLDQAADKLMISTHTLTWSVTLTSFHLNVLCFISTHTLTWSVTCWERNI